MKITLALLSFDEKDAAAIREIASRLECSPPPPGRSEVRELHYNAGRAAVWLALREAGLEGPLSEDPEFGFPVLPGAYVSLSHTDGLAAAALSPTPIGVDVERTDRDVSRVIGRVLHPAETGLPGIIIWTGKEAFTKALGLGLTAGFSRIHVRAEGPQPFSVFTEVTGPRSLKEPRVLVETYGRHTLALSGEKADLARGVRRVEWNPGLPK